MYNTYVLYTHIYDIYTHIYIYTYKFSCPKTNIGPFTRRQPHSSNFYHSTITSSSKKLPGVL